MLFNMFLMFEPSYVSVSHEASSLTFASSQNIFSHFLEVGNIICMLNNILNDHKYETDSNWEDSRTKYAEQSAGCAQKFAQSYVLGITCVSVCWGCYDKNNRNSCSHSSGGWKPKIECQDSWVLARVLFLTQRWLPYSYVLTWSFFFVHTKRKISLASYYLSTRTLILLKQGCTLIPSFSLNYLHRSPISKYSLTENWDFKIGILWEHKHPIYKNLEIEIYYSIFQYKNVSFRQPLFQICDWKYSEDQRSDHQVYQCIQEFCTISISHLD